MFFSFQARSQYSIKLEIKGNKDSVMYMGYYFKNSTYALDTAYNNNGKFIFEKKDKTLDDGLYFFSTKDGKYIEFIVQNNQKFSLKTDEKNWIENMRIKNSKENQLYFEYLKENDKNVKELKKINNQKNSLTDSIYQQKLSFLRSKNDSLKEEFINKNPDHLLSKMFLATKGIKIPNFPTIYKNDSIVDSASMQRERFDYYVHHYFDNIDLKCDGLLHTPKEVFFNQYNNYWEELMKYEIKDSIFSLAQYWIEKTRGTKIMFRFFVHDITERYLKSQYMGHDEVYINMINRYYATGEATWMPPTALDKEVERARLWSNSMLLKTIPDLVCPDSNGVFHNLYSLKSKYKILIFWSYDCGHCIKEVPKIYEFYKKYKDSLDVEVMAVNSGVDVQQWKEKVSFLKLDWLNVNGLIANYDWKDYFDVETTPVVFILDKDNRIVGKKIPADNIEEYIKLYDEGKIKF
jgi:thiol-disulfide isomerase/thioredoxin